ncbi:hypothetical protein [Devosia insulae]|uniref:hypothetical protein n=1 Tax=Devosia insulae TaxID=408174 RepID=UPI00114CF8A6|nr:hypothetical protein [Devosia insulae]
MAVRVALPLLTFTGAASSCTGIPFRIISDPVTSAVIRQNDCVDFSTSTANNCPPGFDDNK